MEFPPPRRRETLPARLGSTQQQHAQPATVPGTTYVTPPGLSYGSHAQVRAGPELGTRYQAKFALSRSTMHQSIPRVFLPAQDLRHIIPILPFIPNNRCNTLKPWTLELRVRKSVAHIPMRPLATGHRRRYWLSGEAVQNPTPNGPDLWTTMIAPPVTRLAPKKGSSFDHTILPEEVLDILKMTALQSTLSLLLAHHERCLPPILPRLTRTR